MDAERFKKTLSSLFATRNVQRVASSMISATMLLGTTLSAAQAAPAPNKGTVKPVYVNPVGGKQFVDDELIVVPQSGLDKEEFQNSVKAIDGEVIQKDLLGKAYLVRVPKEKLDKDFQKALKDKNFRAVQKNMISHTQFTTTPDDPGFQAGLQGCLTQLGIPPAWALGAGGQGVVMGSMDTGVDYVGNQDMKGRTTGIGGGVGYNAKLNTFGGLDEDNAGLGGFGGHGTFCMNCFGASTNNGFGFAAGAFNSSIIPCCIANAKFPGDTSTTDFLVGNALEFLMVNNCQLANLSYGASPPFSFFDFAAHPLLQILFAEYTARGGCIFVAAGNDGLSDLGASSIPGVVPVAAVDATNTPAPFTDFGPHIMFAAPGVNITNTAIGGATITGSGTSFACPYAASVFAMVRSVRPSLPASTIIQIMQKTATPGPSFPQSNFFYGSGIPNAGAAVRLAQTSF